jgi:hypothetical protein
MIALILISILEIYANIVTKMIFLPEFLIYFSLFYYLAKMNRQTQLAIFAVVAALGLLGVIAVESIMTTQEAKAAGCGNP